MSAADDQQISITDNTAQHRFEIRADGKLAGFAEYVREPAAITFVHTEIDPAFEGRGLGSRLAAAALGAARAAHEQVIPLCPFIAAYIRRHPEYDDIVAPHHRGRIAAERAREGSAGHA